MQVLPDGRHVLSLGNMTAWRWTDGDAGLVLPCACIRIDVIVRATVGYLDTTVTERRRIAS